MERPIQKPIGTNLQELDTPALFIDSLGVLNNWAILKSKVENAGKNLRSNASAYRTPALAHFVGIEAIYVDTLSEGLCFAEAGIKDILVGRIPRPDQLGLLKSLEAQCNLTVCLSSLDELKLLSQSRRESVNAISVLFRIALDQLDLGLEPNKELMDILCEDPVGSKNICKGVFFRITGCLTDPLQAGLDQWLEMLDERLGKLRETDRSIVAFHNNPSESLIFSPFVTEIIEDKFLLRDNGLSPDQSGTMGVISSVTSNPEPHLALIDCGQKAIAVDRGLPSVSGSRKRHVERMSAEHGFLIIDPQEDRVRLGERVILSPADAGDTFNIYDYVNVMNNERLSAVWRIESRGKYS